MTTTSISVSYQAKKKKKPTDNPFCTKIIISVISKDCKTLKLTKLTIWGALKHTVRLPWHYAGQVLQAYLRGCVPPGVSIHTAEQGDLIGAVNRLIMRQVLGIPTAIMHPQSHILSVAVREEHIFLELFILQPVQNKSFLSDMLH